MLDADSGFTGALKGLLEALVYDQPEQLSCAS
jgi:hypothetical protein